ncbi:MAG TPA: xylulokinase [Anaerolineae bacterium]|nr:xylulokinase [Anaerolineae bacterium]
MSTTPQLLGIDLGTSSVKVLLATTTGRILGQGSAEYPIHRPRPGWAEQDPDDWWRATITAVRQALAGAGDPPVPVAAIGLSGQMHGTVLLDEAGGLLSPAVIWPDRRSEPQVREITALIGAVRLIELTGSPLATGFQAATVRWMQQERPDLWRRVHTVLLPKDYLRYRLTGDVDTDPSDGSGTLLLDVRRRVWSPDVLAALDIDASQLPPVQPSTAVAGQLSRQAAAALGLPAGTPVVTGAADTACSALGAGIVDARTLLLTISTGGQIVLPAPGVQVDRAGRIHTFCGALPPGPDQAGWYQMAAILSAGMALRWLRDRVFCMPGDAAYAQMVAWAEAAPAGAGGLLFLPYLAGERTPHMDPQARGLFLGLTAGHGRAELVRAVLEGVALACYDAYLVLAELGARPERIVMAGGGARSRLWQQIVADVFGLPVQQLEMGEQSAMGAVLLAGGGVGLLDPGSTAPKWAAYGPPVEPNPRCHATYQALLALFRSAYQKHREDFRQLQNLRRGG